MLRSGLIVVYNFLVSRSGGGSADLLSPVTSNTMQGTGIKLSQGNFRLAITKRLFTKRVVKHWNKLPSEVVMVPILLEFKKYLYNTLRQMANI